MPLTLEQEKKLSAEAAVTRSLEQGFLKVADPQKGGVVVRVGLGTGSTAVLVVDYLAQLVKEGKLTLATLQTISTSDLTQQRAVEVGLPVTPGLPAGTVIDVAFDGADEVEAATLALVKGTGGALLREKLVELQARRFVVVADHTKVVDRLGLKYAVPVEVVKFGWELTVDRLQSALPGVLLTRRVAPPPPSPQQQQQQPYITDEGHYIVDCDFRPVGGISDAAKAAATIKAIPGVIEHGLFIGMAKEAVIGLPDGKVRVLTPTTTPNPA